MKRISQAAEESGDPDPVFESKHFPGPETKQKFKAEKNEIKKIMHLNDFLLEMICVGQPIQGMKTVWQH